jgi:hypothetical protein
MMHRNPRCIGIDVVIQGTQALGIHNAQRYKHPRLQPQCASICHVKPSTVHKQPRCTNIHDAQTSTYKHRRCIDLQYSLTSTMHIYHEYSHSRCTNINYSHTFTMHRYHDLARTHGVFTSARPCIGLIRNEFEPILPSQPSIQIR